jgi:protein TonB
MLKRVLVPCVFLIALCFATINSVSAKSGRIGFARPNNITDTVPVVKEVNIKDLDSSVFDKLEVEASVDPISWRKHLEKELMPVIENAAKKGMKPGHYIVTVRFLVERDGSISEAKALNNPGFGLAKASEKVIKSSPKWTPGEQNGRKVRSYHTQPITYVISEQ